VAQLEEEHEPHPHPAPLAPEMALVSAPAALNAFTLLTIRLV